MHLRSACLWVLLVMATGAQAVDPPDLATQPHLKSWSNAIPVGRRFAVLADFSNEAVLDRETGLVWEKIPQATPLVTWVQARFACADKSVGGRKGWRLPSVSELASLIDPSVSSPGPTLPPGHPFSALGTYYWAATASGNDPDFAWVVFFSNGQVGPPHVKLESYLPWCVRGPAYADAY